MNLNSERTINLYQLSWKIIKLTIITKSQKITNSYFIKINNCQSRLKILESLRRNVNENFNGV